MNTLDKPHPAAFLKSLTELELQVARRADQLAAEGYSSSDLKLVCWLQAEHELLDMPLLARVARDHQPPAGPFTTPCAGGLKELPLSLR